MNDKTQKTYFFRNISTDEFVGAKYNDGAGYYKTTIYDLGHCTVMNARQGHSAAEVEAAKMCSITGHWERFGENVELFKNHKPEFQTGMAVTLKRKTTGDTALVNVSDINEGLVRVVDHQNQHAGLFSYLNGQGVGANEGLSISPA